MKSAGVTVVAAAMVLGLVGAASAAGPIEAATKFLLGWGKGNWEDVAATAADKVTVSVGGKDLALDVPGKKGEAQLVLPFKGLATVREGGKVTAVTVREMTVKAGGEEKKGKGTLALEEKDGNTRITKVTVE
jgi:hypothetical protein